MARHMLVGEVKIRPGNRLTMEDVGDQGGPGMAQLPGFESVTFFLDEERSVYGAASIWGHAKLPWLPMRRPGRSSPRLLAAWRRSP